MEITLTDGVSGGSRFERQGAFAGFTPANMVAPQEWIMELPPWRQS